MLAEWRNVGGTWSTLFTSFLKEPNFALRVLPSLPDSDSFNCFSPANFTGWGGMLRASDWTDPDSAVAASSTDETSLVAAAACIKLRGTFTLLTMSLPQAFCALPFVNVNALLTSLELKFAALAPDFSSDINSFTLVSTDPMKSWFESFSKSYTLIRNCLSPSQPQSSVRSICAGSHFGLKSFATNSER